MAARKATAYILSGLVLLVLAVGGYWLLQRTEPATCRICQRGIHSQSRTVIEVAGTREEVCCARCALTWELQEHQKVRLVEVADYASGRMLKPEDVYFVEGSRIILCQQHEMMLDQTKHPQTAVFDRCAPSLYAFARRQDAEAFASENGGSVRRLPELLKEVEPAP